MTFCPVFVFTEIWEKNFWRIFLLTVPVVLCLSSTKSKMALPRISSGGSA
jgi:hypothetical protein